MPANEISDDRLGPLEFAVATLPHPGQRESGDLHVVREIRDGILVAVIDGLGHGREAAHAAGIAASVLREQPVSSVTDAVHRCHEKLRTTRGVVLTLAMIQPSEKSLVWLSVGNVDGLVLRSDREAQRPSESVLHSPGVVGYQLPVMRPATHDLLPGDLLVMATDGIDADFRRSIIRSDPPRLIAARLLRVHRTGTDDALVLVSRIRDAVEDEVEDEVSSP